MISNLTQTLIYLPYCISYNTKFLYIKTKFKQGFLSENRASHIYPVFRTSLPNILFKFLFPEPKALRFLLIDPSLVSKLFYFFFTVLNPLNEHLQRNECNTAYLVFYNYHVNFVLSKYS